MRWREIIEAADSDIQPGLRKTKKIKLNDGRVCILTIEHTHATEERSDAVTITAEVDGEFAGSASFSHNTNFTQRWDSAKQNTWSASDLHVNSNFRRMGLATEMYAFAVSCGMRIIRSGIGMLSSGTGKLLPDGQKFWDKQAPEWRIGQKPKPPNLYWKRPRVVK